MHLFTILILSLFLTIALIPVLRGLALRLNIVDIPNKRKVHEAPMPKSGGIAMAIGFFIPVMIWVPKDSFVIALLLGTIVISAFGLIDDICELGYKEKLSAQVVAALVVVFYGGVRIKSLGSLAPEGFILPDAASISLTVFVIVGITNAINLSDGLDGLAGGISMLSFVAIGMLAYKCDNLAIEIMSVAAIGSVLGFLRYNTYPAVIFMGDAGSQMLGFLSITLALGLTQENTPFSRVLPLLLIGFPVLDTLTVMTERISKGRSPFKADKNHFHHRLLRLGLFHTESVFIIYALQAVFIYSAFALRYYSEWTGLLFFIIISGFIILMFAITGITGWVFERGRFLDTQIKRRLRAVKEKKIFIKSSFAFLEWGLPVFFFLQCLIPEKIPLYLAIVCAIFFSVMVLIWFFNDKYMGLFLRGLLYLVIPVLVYLTETEGAAWFAGVPAFINNLLFFGIVFFVIATMNLTRRRKGFKVTSLDFLVCLIVIVLPNLPNSGIQTDQVGIIIAKILTLFFSYDVLLGELRGQNNSLALVTALAFATIAIRGF